MTPASPDMHELQRTIEELHARYRPVSSGQVATYIPELQKANPDDFGICIVTADGAEFETVECDRPFTIQSVSKPFTFGMAIEEFGSDTVAKYVGVEPSGDVFNSIALQSESNRPHNPMINAGAIRFLQAVL
jgi:glutaminase